MTTIYPSTLTTSLYGSTRTQSSGFLSYAKPGDIILYSSVALYSDDWYNLFTEIKNKAQNGVYVILLIPQNWCNKAGNYPLGCTNKGAFQLTKDGTTYLKSILYHDFKKSYQNNMVISCFLGKKQDTNKKVELSYKTGKPRAPPEIRIILLLTAVIMNS